MKAARCWFTVSPLMLTAVLTACGPSMKSENALPEARSDRSTFEEEKKLVVEENKFGDEATPEDAKITKGELLSYQMDENCLNPGSVQKGSSQRSHRVEVTEDTSLTTIEADAKTNPCIIGVSRDGFHKASLALNDPSYSSQKQYNYLKYPKALDGFYSSTSGIKKNVVIAIIDTGVSIDHPDLKANIWRNPGEIAANGIDDDRNGYVDDVYGWNFASNNNNPRPSGSSYYHGTHVAGLAAARSNNSVGVSGVNGLKAQIMALNVFGSNSGAYISDTARAIRYAADNGAHIINLSLGGSGRYPDYADALKYATSKGVFVVMAAINSSDEITSSNFYSPAGYAKDIWGSIAVAATDSSTDKLCSFSNYGTSYVEVSAPGCNGIYSTYGTNTYTAINGTSMASPIVAGSASLVYGLIWSRTGTAPTPRKVNEIFRAAFRSNSNLKGLVGNARSLDLLALFNNVNTSFPVQ